MSDPSSLVSKLRSAGRLFEDPDFPATASSLYKPSHVKTHAPRGPSQWARPSQMAPPGCEVALFKGGGGASDVRQGQLGSCYLLGAAASVATRPDLISAIFPFHDAEVGLYQVRICKSGEWITVTVDDRLPVSGGRPAYAHSSDPGETWVAILEKAYAKLHGCYENIEGGSAMQAMVDLTGGVGEKICLTEPRVAEAVRSGALWKRLMRYDDSKFLMGCAHAAKDGAIEKDRGMGIMSGHAYSILQVEEVANGKHKLLRIRNPWGEGEWKGRWSDGSPEWTRKIQQQLRYEFGDDGTFWIEFDDFLRQFNKIHVCRLYEDSHGARWPKFQASSEWRGESAGGCMNHASWTENPQWGLQVTGKRTRAFISVSQPDVRLSGGNSFPIAIGFYVLRTKSLGRKKATASQQDIVFESSFSYTRDVSMELALTPDSYYVIVPATYEPQQCTPFTLTVFTESPARVSELSPGPTARLSGQWTFGNAGGCPSHIDTWPRNPMYALLPSEPCVVHIGLSQPEVRAPKVLNAIGFQVYACGKGNGARLDRYEEPLAQSEYMQGGTVGATVTFEGGNSPLIIVPSTFLPMKTGSFTLRIATTAPFALGPCPADAGEEWNGMRVAASRGSSGTGPDAKWFDGSGDPSMDDPLTIKRKSARQGASAAAAAAAAAASQSSSSRRSNVPERAGVRTNRGRDGGDSARVPQSARSLASSASSRSSSSSATSANANGRFDGRGHAVVPPDEDEMEPDEDAMLRTIGVDKEKVRSGRGGFGNLAEPDDAIVREAISYNLWSRVNPGFTVEPVRSVAQEAFQYDPEEARRVRVSSHNRVKNDYTQFVEQRAMQNNLLKKS